MESVCVAAISADEYHNTKKLLENYRMLKYIYITRVGKFDFELQKEADENRCTVNELIQEAEKLNMAPFEGGDLQKRQIQWMEIAISYLHKNIFLLRLYPNKGELYYQLITQYYIQPCKASLPRIAEKNCLSVRTCQRKMKEAITELDRLLWSNPNLESAIKQQIVSQYNSGQYYRSIAGTSAAELFAEGF